MFLCIRTMQFRKRDVVFLIMAAVLLIFSVLDWWYLPYERALSVTIDSPYYSTVDEAGNHYVVNSGKSEILKINPAGKVHHKIMMVNHEADSFGEANEIAVDKNGNIYVQDVIWNDTGLGLAAERIIRFDQNGHFLNVVYEADYSDVLVTKRHLFSLRIIDNMLMFAAADPDGTQFFIMGVNTASGEGVVRLSSFSRDNIENAQYIAVCGKDSAYIVEKTGTISFMTTEGETNVYESEEGQYLLPFQMTVDQGGKAYITDICNQCVYQLSGGEGGGIEVLFDSRALSEMTGLDMENSVLLNLNVVSVQGKTKLCITADTGYAVLDLADRSAVSYAEAPYETFLQFMIIVRYAALVISMLILLYYAAALLIYLFKSGVIKEKMMSVMLIVCVAVTGLFIMTSMLARFRINFIDEQIGNICTVSQIASSIMDKEAFAHVNYPSDYQTDEYHILQNNMKQLIEMKSEYSGNMYCNLVKMQNGRFYAFAYLDNSIGAFYPLDEKERSEVKEVYETGEMFINDGKADATGAYTYVKSPIKNADGSVIGVVEIGMVADTLTGIVDQMRMDIMVHITLILIIAVFLLNEIYGFVNDRKQWIQETNTRGKGLFPQPYLRVLIFFTTLAYNMPTSFLPVYVARFYNESLPITEDLAGSLPLTANFFMVGLVAIFCSAMLRKMGFRFTMILGGLIVAAADFLTAVSTNWWMAMIGILVNGIGVGILLNGLFIIVADQDDEKAKSGGFSIINGSMLSGMICGTVIGATLAEKIGEAKMFFASCGLWGLIALIALFAGGLFKTSPNQAETSRKEKKGVPVLFSREILGFLILVAIPYVIVNGFTSYFLPVFGDAYGLTESQTSLFLVMNCLVGIFLSGTLTDICMKYLGKASLYLSSALSLGAVLVFGYFQNLYMLAFALFVLGAARSFGATTRELIFCAQPKVQKIGEDKAMGYYNFADNIGESIGTIVFGGIMRVGFVSGMWALTGISAGLLALFGISDARNSGKKEK